MNMVLLPYMTSTMQASCEREKPQKTTLHVCSYLHGLQTFTPSF